MSGKSSQFVIGTSFPLKGIPCCSGSMRLTNSEIPASFASHNPNCLHPLFLPLLRSAKPLLFPSNPIIFCSCQGTHILNLLHTHSLNYCFPLHGSFCCSCHCHPHDHKNQWHLCAELHHRYYPLRCLAASSTRVTMLVMDSDPFYQTRRFKMSIELFSTKDTPEFSCLEIWLQLPMAVGSKFCDFLRMISSLQLQKDGTIVHSKIPPKIRTNKKKKKV